MTLKLRKGDRPTKYAVHFSYVGTAGSTSAASFARRSWPDSRSSGAAEQRGKPVTGVLARSSGSAELSRTIGNIDATLLPTLVGLSLGSHQQRVTRRAIQLLERLD